MIHPDEVSNVVHKMIMEPTGVKLPLIKKHGLQISIYIWVNINPHDDQTYRLTWVSWSQAHVMR